MPIVRVSQMMIAPTVAALEDFTTYTEFDEGDDVIIDSATKVSWTYLISRQQTAYVYKDKGVNYFSGDFTHKLETYFYSMDSNQYAINWMLANMVGDIYDVVAASGDGYAFDVFDIDESLELKIIENGNQTTDIWASPGPQENTLYFIEIVRDDGGGANSTGRLTAYIRIDSHTGALQDTLVLDCAAGEQNDFRYVYALATYDNGHTSAFAHGYTQNLGLG